MFSKKEGDLVTQRHRDNERERMTEVKKTKSDKT